MKTLTKQVLEILQDTKKSTLILSEVIRIDEFKIVFEQAIKSRDEYIVGGDHFIHEESEYKGNKKAVNAVKAAQRQRAKQTL